MPTPTGNRVLDDALDGGVPEERTVLLTGGPGTGKTTMAMQFLQAGLDAGENCLFVSTEQTYEELADAFSAFAFDVDHENLTVTSIHATQGYTLESDEEELTLQTLEGGATLGGGYSAPFEPTHITEYLEQFGPVDRVVLDSISGLSAMGESFDRYRRAVFDLIRLFNDEFGATALLTAEESNPESGVEGADTIAAADSIQFNAHGVLRVWRENLEGDYHRFVEITKMRGVDHDTRVFEIEFTRNGVRVAPRKRSTPNQFARDETLPTGIEGLDELVGGGVQLGGSVLFQHDGEATPLPFVTKLLERALEEDMAVTFVPPVELPPEAVTEQQIPRARELIDDDRLFLVDFPNIWENSLRNVFKPREHGDDPVDVFRTIDERRGDRPMLSLVNVEAQLPYLEREDIRRMRFWEEENFFSPRDTSLYFFNPETLDSRLASFYKNGAQQILSTWRSRHGLPYIELKNSPKGFVGSTRLVEYLDEPPYVRVQRPPRPGDGGGQNE